MKKIRVECGENSNQIRIECASNLAKIRDKSARSAVKVLAVLAFSLQPGGKCRLLFAAKFGLDEIELSVHAGGDASISAENGPLMAAKKIPKRYIFFWRWPIFGHAARESVLW